MTANNPHYQESPNADSESVIAAIKARRDWRVGRDLSPFELRLDDEHLAKHYAEDVAVLDALADWEPDDNRKETR